MKKNQSSSLNQQVLNTGAVNTTEIRTNDAMELNAEQQSNSELNDQGVFVDAMTDEDEFMSPNVPILDHRTDDLNYFKREEEMDIEKFLKSISLEEKSKLYNLSKKMLGMNENETFESMKWQDFSSNECVDEYTLQTVVSKYRWDLEQRKWIVEPQKYFSILKNQSEDYVLNNLLNFVYYESAYHDAPPVEQLVILEYVSIKRYELNIHTRSYRSFYSHSKSDHAWFRLSNPPNTITQVERIFGVSILGKNEIQPTILVAYGGIAEKKTGESNVYEISVGDPQFVDLDHIMYGVATLQRDNEIDVIFPSIE